MIRISDDTEQHLELWLESSQQNGSDTMLDCAADHVAKKPQNQKTLQTSIYTWVLSNHN